MNEDANGSNALCPLEENADQQKVNVLIGLCHFTG